MKRKLLIGCAFAVAMSIGFDKGVLAQQQQQQQQQSHAGHDHGAQDGHDHAAQDGHDHEAHAGHEHGDHQHTGETLAYALPEWKTMHFEDATKAAQHAEAVKKLGCEVKQDSHAGHTDLSYRCAQWKSVAVESHQLAEQWTGWLKSSGFDVSHGHVAPKYSKGPETVEFRLVKWTSVHGKGGEKDTQFITALKELGIEVNFKDHGDHSDIQYRSPVWRDVHLADHQTAEQISGWLKQQGFEIAPHKHK